MMLTTLRSLLLVVLALSALCAARSLPKDSRAFFYVPRLPALSPDDDVMTDDVINHGDHVTEEDGQLLSARAAAFFFKPRHLAPTQITREVRAAPVPDRRGAFFFIPGDQLPEPRLHDDSDVISDVTKRSVGSEGAALNNIHPPDCRTFCKGRCNRRGKCMPVRSKRAALQPTQDYPTSTDGAVIY
eukprot:sb/3471349/